MIHVSRRYKGDAAFLNGETIIYLPKTCENCVISLELVGPQIQMSFDSSPAQHGKQK